MDALLSSRKDESSECTTSIKTQFLKEMDGALTSSKDSVFVIGATNLPQAIDDAVKRRMPTRIFVKLPDAAARAAVLKKLLVDSRKKHQLTDTDFG